MRYSVSMPNFDYFGDPRYVAELAAAAERAGWDGVYVWDHVTYVAGERAEVADPWILLTAAALATERIRLGTLVTPLPRRRPAKLARETVTLDRLTGGRLVLGVGLGSPVDDEYGAFGEPTDLRILAERLDEGLDVLTGLWSGQPVRYEGRHHVVRDVVFRPGPVQRPRIPIWVAGVWPNRRPLRRAARWDGVVPLVSHPQRGYADPAPAELAEILGVVRAERERAGLGGPFDVLVSGETSGTDAAADRALVAAYAEAGATWFNEAISHWRAPAEQAMQRVRLGPPRL